MKNTQILFATVVILAALLVGWLLIRLDEKSHLGQDTNDQVPVGMQALEFCGVTYYAEPVVLFGVDILPRIAETATERPETFVCENLAANPDYPTTPLSVEVINNPSDASGIYDYLRIDSLQFSFNAETKEIFLHSGFDGTPMLFGLLK